jgi:sugar/nucleoside kinase (ribokinase family)
VPGFAVEVVDSLGAGDAFVAAMLSHLVYAPKEAKLSDEQLRDIMRYANAAGALACTKRGVIPALPRPSEIEAFLHSRADSPPPTR